MGEPVRNNKFPSSFFRRPPGPSYAGGRNRGCHRPTGKAEQPARRTLRPPAVCPQNPGKSCLARCTSPGFPEWSCLPYVGGTEQLSVDSSCIFTFLSQRTVARGRLSVE